MLVYSLRSDTEIISNKIRQFSQLHIKQFGGGVGTADFGKAEQWNSKITDDILKLSGDALRAITDPIKARLVKVGNILHLKKGLAKVIKIKKGKGKSNIEVEYISGEQKGKKESKTVDDDEELYVVNEAKVKGSKSSKPDKSENTKKAKDIQYGDEIVTSKGTARVSSVEKDYKSEAGKKDPNWKPGDKKKVKISYKYTDGDSKGEESFGIYSEDSNVTLKAKEEPKEEPKKPEAEKSNSSEKETSKDSKSSSESKLPSIDDLPEKKHRTTDEWIQAEEKENEKIQGILKQYQDKRNRTEDDIANMRKLLKQYRENQKTINDLKAYKRKTESK